MSLKDAVPGVKYKVTFADCCGECAFTAVLLSRWTETEPAVFSNWVRIEGTGVQAEEVP